MKKVNYKNLVSNKLERLQSLQTEPFTMSHTEHKTLSYVCPTKISKYIKITTTQLWGLEK